MIELRHVVAGYGNKPVLRDVSIRCPPGKVTVLCGPNGCGKSTALKVAARLLQPAAGEVWVGERRADAFGVRAYATQVAVLPQLRNSASLTAKSLVLHGRFPYLGYPRRYSADDQRLARQAMERTGTWKFAAAPVSSLSGGERQKVYLAMCLAQDTPILLLDEPTTYLDISHQLALMRLVRELAAEGRTVFMVLHDLNLAMTSADQMVVMEGGMVRRMGTPEEIYEDGVIGRVFHVRAERVRTAAGAVQYLLTSGPDRSLSGGEKH